MPLTSVYSFFWKYVSYSSSEYHASFSGSLVFPSRAFPQAGRTTLSTKLGAVTSGVRIVQYSSIVFCGKRDRESLRRVDIVISHFQVFSQVGPSCLLDLLFCKLRGCLMSSAASFRRRPQGEYDPMVLYLLYLEEDAR